MGKNCKKLRVAFLLIVLFSSVVITCIKTQSQDTDEGAEINAYVNGEIPPIRVTEWTSINLTIVDRTGINWTKFEKTIPAFTRRWIWPIMFGRGLLGYTSLCLRPEIIEGNPKGWVLRVNHSGIEHTTTGIKHKITLDVKTDDSAVDYAVVAGIKCTRNDTYGKPLGSSYIYIPLKASPANFIKMSTSKTEKTASPKSIVYFDIDITNEGYYKDVFQFEIEEGHDLKAQFDTQDPVIEPGETKQMKLYVLTPSKFLDFGTPNQIDIYAYSTGSSKRTHVGSLIVITKGIYISPLVGIIGVPIIIVLVVIYVLFYCIKNKRDRELFGKPDKPWLLSEEKKYLKELKKNDKKEYDEVRQAMRCEYKSALLWFSSYRKSTKEKPKSERRYVIDFFANPLKKITEIKKSPKNGAIKQKVKNDMKEENQRLEEIESEQKRKDEKIRKRVQLEDKEKNLRKKALFEIKHKQEKQRKKFSK